MQQKGSFWFIVVLLFPLLAFAEQTHQVRLLNQFDRAIDSLQVGSITFQGVQPESETDYHPIHSGRISIRGQLKGKGNIFLDGTLFIPHTDPQPWTLVLDENRRFSIVSDLPPAAFDEQAVPAPTALASRIRLRFENRFSGRILEVRVADVAYQNIPAGSTTGYVWLPSGTLDVGLDIEGFGPSAVQEQIYIPSEAYQRYRLRLDERGRLILIQES